jgi:trans-aconitate methyltransferase
MNAAMEKDYFNRDYYKRFYVNRATRIRDTTNIPDLADFVFSYLRHLHLPVRTVLDVGCGLGEWKIACEKAYPKSRFQGIEYSGYLCGKLGWKQGSAVDFKLSRTYDLVICQSVLQYLTDHDARRALRNLARHCHGALYLEVVTKKDWHDHCDQRVTDDNIHLRTGAWYRRELRSRFRTLGGGLFITKKAPAVLWEMEGC